MQDILQSLSSTLKLNTPSPVQQLNLSWLGDDLPQVWVKRDDLIHPIISGNKWRKLKYALLEASQSHTKNLISFGGGFSNHLHALGYCCHHLGIHLTAIVRGDYTANPTPMLQDLHNWGVDIKYVDRKTYQKRNEAAYLAELAEYYQGTVIPEGGSQHQALNGVSEVISELNEHYDYILCPVGSGGTLAGLIHGTQSMQTRLIGVAVLKGQEYLEDLVKELLPHPTNQANWQINHQYHFGGYAKRNSELVEFCNQFSNQTGIEIEPVYSGKLFFALCDMLKQGAFSPQDKILAIHTGGLQGTRSS